MRGAAECGTIRSLWYCLPGRVGRGDLDPMSRMSRSQILVTIARARRWIVALVAAGPALAFAQTATPAVSPLVAFSGSQTAASPVIGPDGALYGTTSTVNVVTGGLIYRLAVDGSDGRLYGTTSLGAASQANSSGTVYRVGIDGSAFTTLHRFESYSSLNASGAPINADGANPEAELVEGSDGFLYGVTRTGGSKGTGVVFKIAKDGSDFAVLHTFGAITSAADVTPATNADGIGPGAPLVLASDGYFYGTAARGGANGVGTLFRVHFDGTGFEVLHTFPALVASTTTPATNEDGAVPLAGLTDGGDGRLYGVTNVGGSAGNGTIFALDPVGGVFSVLHNFDGTKGANPTGELLLAEDGKLYGTTATGGTNSSGNGTLFGTIFSIARDGTGFTSLFSFSGNDGSNPSGRLLQLDASTFVGVTQGGGRCGQGTVYQFSLTGAKADGITNCGRKKNSGGGGTAPVLLLLLAVAGVARKFATR
jgi:uncharacterized repeat protein (TIGR03803 family)